METQDIYGIIGVAVFIGSCLTIWFGRLSKAEVEKMEREKKEYSESHPFAKLTKTIGKYNGTVDNLVESLDAFFEMQKKNSSGHNERYTKQYSEQFEEIKKIYKDQERVIPSDRYKKQDTGYINTLVSFGAMNIIRS